MEKRLGGAPGREERTLECRAHAGVEADITCMECGREFCRECVKESGDSQCCPECHAASVERLAIQMGVAKKKAGKAPKERRAEAGEKKAPKERRSSGGEIKARRKNAKTAFPGLEEQAGPPRVLLPDEEPGPAGAKEAGLSTQGEVEPAAGEVKKGRPMRKPLRRPADRPAAPAAPGPGAEGPPAAVPESPSPQEKEEFWGGEKAQRARRLRRASKAVSMRVPEEYEGELTAEPAYLKAVLWALLAGVVTGGLYGTVAWLRPRGVPGIFGWFIGFAVGVTVVVASGRHFNWKLGLIAAGVALAFLCIGYVLSNVLRFWFPRNALDLIIKTQSTWERLRLAFVNLKDQFPGNWWWLIFAITGATAFLVSFRPWPFKLNAGGSKATGEAGPAE